MNSQQAAAVRVFQKNCLLQQQGTLESVSGCGSSSKAAFQAVSFISEIIQDFSIRSLIDCPCGDFHWMQKVDFGSSTYHGYDLVEALVVRNRVSHPPFSFSVFDAIHQKLPRADLIVCRDFLFHLHFSDGIKVLNNFKESGSPYLVTTSFNALKQNHDLAVHDVYGFRKINVSIDPYNLGEPVLSRCEFGDRYLNLYKL